MQQQKVGVVCGMLTYKLAVACKLSVRTYSLQREEGEGRGGGEREEGINKTL